MVKSTTARDAILEAEGWKETARKWRRRALRGMTGWKNRAEQIQDELNEAERERDELLEEIEPLREHAKIAVTPAELVDLRRKVKIAEQEAEEQKRKTLFAERCLKDAQAAKQKAEANAERFRHDANSAREALGKETERLTKKLVQPARASLRVIGTRLGIEPGWYGSIFLDQLHGGGSAGAKTDDQVLAEIDRRILELQSKAVEIDAEIDRRVRLLRGE